MISLKNYPDDFMKSRSKRWLKVKKKLKKIFHTKLRRKELDKPYSQGQQIAKKYRFDYIKEDVMKWAPEVRKAMTKQMIYMLPYRISLPFIMPDRIIPAMDYYGEVIDNYDEWKRQREEYIEELYKQLKNGEEYEKDS